DAAVDAEEEDPEDRRPDDRPDDQSFDRRERDERDEQSLDRATARLAREIALDGDDLSDAEVLAARDGRLALEQHALGTAPASFRESLTHRFPSSREAVRSR